MRATHADEERQRRGDAHHGRRADRHAAAHSASANPVAGGLAQVDCRPLADWPEPRRSGCGACRAQSADNDDVADDDAEQHLSSQSKQHKYT